MQRQLFIQEYYFVKFLFSNTCKITSKIEYFLHEILRNQLEGGYWYNRKNVGLVYCDEENGKYLTRIIVLRNRFSGHVIFPGHTKKNLCSNIRLAG